MIQASKTFMPHMTSPDLQHIISPDLSGSAGARVLSNVLESDDWSLARRWFFRVLTSEYTEHCLGVVIVTNLAMIIMETDMAAEVGPPGQGTTQEVPLGIILINRMLLFLYIVELASRLFVLRFKFFFDWWCVLDFLIVSLDLIFWLVESGVGTMPEILMIRCIRLVRIARAFRALRMFPELNFLLSGLARAVKAIVWGVLMLHFVILIWAILAVQLLNPITRQVDELGHFEGCDRCPHAFESVWSAIKTFFQQLVAGDSWGSVSLPIIDFSPWTYFFFLSVLVSISLAVMNLILAVIVDNGQQAQRDAMEEYKKKEKQRD